MLNVECRMFTPSPKREARGEGKQARQSESAAQNIEMRPQIDQCEAEINQKHPTAIAAIEQQVINPRYVRPLDAEQRVATIPIVHENAAMEMTVPTPNARRYVSACAVLGNARIGSTPRKCELPATPCRMPIPNAACVCRCDSDRSCDFG